MDSIFDINIREVLKDKNITIVCDGLPPPKQTDNYYISCSALEPKHSFLSFMTDGYIGVITQSMTADDVMEEYRSAILTIGHLNELSKSKYFDTDDYQSIVKALLFERYLNNSIIRQDAQTFSECLECICSLELFSGYKHIITRLEYLIDNIKDNVFTWYQLYEVTEMLAHHVFRPLNAMPKDILRA